MVEEPGTLRAAESVDWPDISHTYDVVADDYATAFADELAGKPFDRELLDRYASAVAGQGAVWDVGCGPAAHVTRYLADRGVDVAGVDLSPRVVDVARSRERDLRFGVADMCDLPAEDGSLAGIVAFYSVIHLPRERIPEALAEFRRVLARDGALLLAMHGGEGIISTDEWLGHAVPIRATLMSPGELAEAVEAAGFTLVEQHAREPYEGEYPSRRLQVWATAGR
ncbi:class I SAM-dependent methyltransferase [Actinomadura sp. HBU206391]|uniref:class I SAM-dependent methyltransferase n=1 Tax=Actinomadura sp. HBU206391 TaxID=2731692 RepID=UPI001650D21B|nr:class I SAM-dependent methyltransferase [Actinomadura sp. HBU206391]MBC6457255.1 class I SAM-dependent methyltransferase [Actinomadura sp. HBU206391]